MNVITSSDSLAVKEQKYRMPGAEIKLFYQGTLSNEPENNHF